MMRSSPSLKKRVSQFIPFGKKSKNKAKDASRGSLEAPSSSSSAFSFALSPSPSPAPSPTLSDASTLVAAAAPDELSNLMKGMDLAEVPVVATAQEEAPAMGAEVLGGEASGTGEEPTAALAKASAAVEQEAQTTANVAEAQSIQAATEAAADDASPAGVPANDSHAVHDEASSADTEDADTAPAPPPPYFSTGASTAAQSVPASSPPVTAAAPEAAPEGNPESQASVVIDKPVAGAAQDEVPSADAGDSTIALHAVGAPLSPLPAPAPSPAATEAGPEPKPASRASASNGEPAAGAVQVEERLATAEYPTTALSAGCASTSAHPSPAPAPAPNPPPTRVALKPNRVKEQVEPGPWRREGGRLVRG